MKHLLSALLICIVGAVLPLVNGEAASGHTAPVHHDLKVVINPGGHSVKAEDTITVTGNLFPEFRFSLHSGLKPLSKTRGVEIIRENAKRRGIDIESFRVKLARGLKTFVLQYGGSIYHPLEKGKEQARGFSRTPGVISEEGVFLSAGSFWYPVFDAGLLTFSLDVDMPEGWDAVSQGDRTTHIQENGVTRVRWEASYPQEEIFLSAGRFTEYTRSTGRISSMVFLRRPDEKLAVTYLDATGRYIAMYEKLIGPYPYKKFALVENFWETGYGMPSFTLLGSSVIRLPFIINSSYPHEILHNWWGNGVFPDYSSGNWSEGLTAYLSDHLLKEQEGNGPEYRRETLQKYTDYVLSGRDFPLTRFVSRHSSSSEAVGYGKSLMFFHMLRLELGDKTFTEGLRNFYLKNRFRLASFEDTRKSFEYVSGKDLGREFDQWVKRIGGPKIQLRNVRAHEESGGYLLTAVIDQVQPGAAYRLNLPVAVTIEGKKKAYQTTATMDKKSLELRLRLPSRPLRVDIDPEFDIFRKLDHDEIPTAVSQTLGAKKMLILFPSSSDSAMLQAYREFSKMLGSAGPDSFEERLDSEVEKLPSDRTVVILGWENLFFNKAVSALSQYDVTTGQKGLRVAGKEIRRKDHSVVLTSGNPENKDMAITFIASPAEALPGLGRKLPHYHKYSYLVFEGSEPSNIIRGRWPVLHSPLTAFLPDRAGKNTWTEMGELVKRMPLALPRAFSAERMMETIGFLSGDELGGRGFGSEGLDRAAEFIAEKFREAGLEPAGDAEGSYFQVWEDKGGIPERPATMKNIVGVIRGKNPEMSGQSVVVGAHYDHLGLGWPDVREENKGKIHHGADDNASGVAVLLELAAVLARDLKPDRSIVFAAFTGEEAGKRGSRYYVGNEKRFPAQKCIGMVNLDTVGRLGRKKLLVLGAGSAREWMHIFRGAGLVTGVEMDAVSERLDSSDQTSFEEAGVPAVQLFSGPHSDYHRPGDTADKIDSEGLAKVASVAKEVVEYLSARLERMTETATKSEDHEAGSKGERKVSLGAVPDFSYSGIGCRLSGTVPGSPADTCGLKEGDVIIRMNSHDVKGLKDLSDELKSLSPGTKISITILRDGKEMTVEAEVKAR